ncbi:ATPase P [Clostridium sp. AM58-1XD]|uniref:ATPase P n=1 Tax=Clostridium sp. AM58-1XD TaxID=2292307 RepID=UPI00268CA701
MIFKPRQLGAGSLPDNELVQDKKACRKFGPCGVGKKALYLNSFYIDRQYYIPIPSVTRVFKRVAMSKGGFTGKGIFASIPYLVVEYDNGKEKQCNFKYEQNVDLMLACLQKEHPELKFVSASVEKRLAEKEAERAARPVAVISNQAQKEAKRLELALDYLNRQPELAVNLSAAAKAKRVNERTNPAYKWTALAITLLGLAALAYGIWSFVHKSGYSFYFTLFGLAAIFLFSGANVLPTAAITKKR